MLILIANPHAGHGRCRKIAAQVQSALQSAGVDFVLRWTDGPHHATTLAQQAVADGADTIVAIGGDGTVAEVLCGIAGSSATLGIVPAGTGNDFATGLGIKTGDIAQNVAILLSGKTRLCDIGKIDDRYFLNVFALGIDIDLHEVSLKLKKFTRGMLTYLLAVLLVIPRFKSKHIKMQADGKIIERDVVLLAIGNGDRFGGGMKVTPKAKVDDGLLDVCLVRDCSRLRILRLLPMFIAGKHTCVPECEYFTVREASISGDHLQVEYDGEVDLHLPVHIRIADEKIKVLSPSKI